MTATLQAAVADPAVLAQLGWLITAQSWSGFGAGGEELPVEAEALPVRKAKQPNDAARNVVAAAEATEAEAAQTVQARRDDVAAAQEGLGFVRSTGIRDMEVSRQVGSEPGRKCRS